MKLNEISLFEVEKLFFTEKKDRKLEDKFHFVLELKNWLTIIDVFGDWKFYKIIFEKGKGIHWIDLTDEMNMDVKFLNSDFQILFEKNFEEKKLPEIIPLLNEQLKRFNFIEKDTFLEDIFTNLK